MLNLWKCIGGRPGKKLILLLVPLITIQDFANRADRNQAWTDLGNQDEFSMALPTEEQLQVINDGGCICLTKAFCKYATVVYLRPLLGLITMGTGAISNSFTAFWNSTPHIVLLYPDLIRGAVLILISTWYANFNNIQEKPAISYIETEECIGGGVGTKGNGRRGKERREGKLAPGM